MDSEVRASQSTVSRVSAFFVKTSRVHCVHSATRFGSAATRLAEASTTRAFSPIANASLGIASKPMSRMPTIPVDRHATTRDDTVASGDDDASRRVARAVVIASNFALRLAASACCPAVGGGGGAPPPPALASSMTVVLPFLNAHCASTVSVATSCFPLQSSFWCFRITPVSVSI